MEMVDGVGLVGGAWRRGMVEGAFAVLVGAFFGRGQEHLHGVSLGFGNEDIRLSGAMALIVCSRMRY